MTDVTLLLCVNLQHFSCIDDSIRPHRALLVKLCSCIYKIAFASQSTPVRELGVLYIFAGLQKRGELGFQSHLLPRHP